MKIFRTLAFSALVAVTGTGCSMMAPQYSASMDNVQTLNDKGNYAAKLGGFESTPDKGNANPISLRGSTLTSPYQNSYAAYISEALKQELTLAKKFAPDAETEISGTLLKNDVDVSGFSLGNTDIAVRFVVKRKGQARYDSVKSVHHEFPSSFAGAVAIPNGVKSYAEAVQKLLAMLYADDQFVTSLKQ